MKSPDELSVSLARQWDNADLREIRITSHPDAWPITLSIGKPTAAAVRNQIGKVREHFQTWRQVKSGEIIWEEANYRSNNEAVRYPAKWVVANIEEWMTACDDKTVLSESRVLFSLLAAADPEFHSLLIRRRYLWKDRDFFEVKLALQLAAQLEPGCADGLPLRALPLVGNDTKFFERNERLLLALLDTRFDGEATTQGLEPFLGASSERGHWLLVIDLDGSLLPFAQCRLRATELAQNSLPGSHVLIVENETCQYQLPKLPGTIAILGSGFDLAWTASDWLQKRHVAYWGDLDTWGLELLARARRNLPDLSALLMTKEIFEDHALNAVPERTPAEASPS
ncbi:MAG: DUF3322 domain-containing protein, partial [Verrucomicrobiota bacterium]